MFKCVKRGSIMYRQSSLHQSVELDDWMAEMVAPPLERPTCTGMAGGLRRLGGAGAARRLGGSLGEEWIKLCGSSVTKMGTLYVIG
jgi:hypothetical protein